MTIFVIMRSLKSLETRSSSQYRMSTAFSQRAVSGGVSALSTARRALTTTGGHSSRFAAAAACAAASAAAAAAASLATAAALALRSAAPASRPVRSTSHTTTAAAAAAASKPTTTPDAKDQNAMVLAGAVATLPWPHRGPRRQTAHEAFSRAVSHS